MKAASWNDRRLPYRVALLAGLLPCTVQAQDLEPAVRVYGGEPAKTCEWPTTVGLKMCTGTLIHPRVMIYAAHCGKRVPAIEFGEKYGANPKKVATEFCATSPGYRSESDLQKGVDFAFCVLKEPVKDIPIAPIGYGCEMDEIIKNKPKVWVVGFGKNDLGAGKRGTKVKVETSFGGEMTEGKEFLVGGPEGSGCNGDSGGPVYAKLSDGSWRTIGITSCGDPSCKSGAVYTNPEIMVPWMHKTIKEKGIEDIDVTPCFDDDGKWAPTKDCGGFATDPGSAFGAWDNFCSEGAPKSGASSMCGDPHPEAGGGKKDEKAPQVEIGSPEEDSVFEVDKTIKVEVKASDDQDEEPDVTLFVDGKAKTTLEKGPYRWELEDLAAGEHKIYAKAEDKAGNESKSESISFKIENDSQKNSGSSSENKSESPKQSPSAAPSKEDSDDQSAQSGDSPKADTDEPSQEKGGCNQSDERSPLFALGAMLLGLGLRRSRSQKR